MIKSGTYKDEYNFDGIKEYVVFAEKNNPSELMAVSKTQHSEYALNNIRLCKAPYIRESRVRHFSREECLDGNHNSEEECMKYQAFDDHLNIEDCKVTLFTDEFDNTSDADAPKTKEDEGDFNYNDM